MNEKLKKIRNEEFNKYRQAIMPAPPAIVHFDAGFKAAIPHIRQDERERVLERVKYYALGVAEDVERELKKMDEISPELEYILKLEEKYKQECRDAGCLGCPDCKAIGWKKEDEAKDEL